MISLELARKLKEAGLEWEPKTGDWFYRKDGAIGIVIDVSGGDWWAIFPPDGKEVAFCIEEADGFIFDPRLDQLLAKIRELGYKWFTETDTERYFIRVVEIKKPNNFHVIFSDSPANAAAEALLWIYERRNQHES